LAYDLILPTKKGIPAVTAAPLMELEFGRDLAIFILSLTGSMNQESRYT